jgi:hypothetical protein
MSALSLRLPESLHRKIRELAERDAVSINQFIATAVAEKTATLLAVEYLEARGRQGSRRLFDRVLARVPDVAPISGDEGPPRRPGKALQPTSRAKSLATKSTPSRAARG